MMDLTNVPAWRLDEMLLPRGGCSAEQRAAAQQEIKRRHGLPKIKLTKPAEPPPVKFVPGFGWAYTDT
jgi:hypothetical protein